MSGVHNFFRQIGGMAAAVKRELMKREREWDEREANYKKTVETVMKAVREGRHPDAVRNLPVCEHCWLMRDDSDLGGICITCTRHVPCEKFCKRKGVVTNGRDYCSQECYDTYKKSTMCCK
jgi:hypothetical protein